MNTKKVLFRLACVIGVGVLVIVGALYLGLPNSTRPEAEQYAVYSAYLEEGVNGDSPRPVDRRDSAVIISTTIPINAEEVRRLSTTERWRDSFRLVRYLQEVADPPSRELRWNLFRVNLWTHELDRSFKLSGEYKVVDPTWLLTPRSRRQSDGFHQFSSVAFTHDLTEALFYTEYGCSLCGRGQYVRMRRTEGKWKVVKRYVIWVS